MALTFQGPLPSQPQQGATDLLLRGEHSDAYVEALRHALAAARLNALFPPSRRLLAHAAFLGARGSEGLYPELRLSRTSGLPSAFDVLRVNVDHGLAREFLEKLGPAHERTPDTAAVARRLAYYQRLRQREVMPLNRMEVDLRQQLPQERAALFRIVLDRYDMRRSQFVRYTILLGQGHRFWRRRHITVDDSDLVAATEEFRRTVGLLSFHGARQSFQMLAQVDQLKVEDVRRCRVGPVFLPGMDLDGPLAALLDRASGPCAGGPTPLVLCLPEDRASVELAIDSGRDLPPLLRGDGGEERAGQEDHHVAPGYHVTHSCKLVCPPPLVEPLQQLCRELGAPSIVRAF